MIAAPRSLIRVTGIALAIVGVFKFSAGRASAACGDYVRIAGQPAEAAVPSPPDHDRGDFPRPPCHGPNCSNHPSQPATPLTAPVAEVLAAKGLAGRSHAADRANGSSRHRAPRTIG